MREIVVLIDGFPILDVKRVTAGGKLMRCRLVFIFVLLPVTLPESVGKMYFSVHPLCSSVSQVVNY